MNIERLKSRINEQLNGQEGLGLDQYRKLTTVISRIIDQEAASSSAQPFPQKPDSYKDGHRTPYERALTEQYRSFDGDPLDPPNSIPESSRPARRDSFMRDGDIG